jgi:hypothetical protein
LLLKSHNPFKVFEVYKPPAIAPTINTPSIIGLLKEKGFLVTKCAIKTAAAAVETTPEAIRKFLFSGVMR